MKKVGKNANEVLATVNYYINELTSYGGKLAIREVYEELSIFDWWNENLSLSQLRDMEKFLNVAIRNSFDGYVCFKVGASGCANGMWAHKEKSLNGYSPEGAVLYKSFVSTYNYWSVSFDGENWLPENERYDSIKTIKDIERIIEEVGK